MPCTDLCQVSYQQHTYFRFNFFYGRLFPLHTLAATQHYRSHWVMVGKWHSPLPRAKANNTQAQSNKNQSTLTQNKQTISISWMHALVCHRSLMNILMQMFSLYMWNICCLSQFLTIFKLRPTIPIFEYVMVVAFSSLARTWGECSPPVLFFSRWRLARAH